jgi:CspA family cold shock protein
MVAESDAERGWSFIAPADGSKEVLVHFSVILMGGYRKLEPGQQVSFELEQGPRCPQACMVQVIGNPEETAAA